MKKMKKHLAVLVAAILFNTTAFCQWHCAVAHITKDGVFTCDFNGTYYPEYIKDSSIKKWFIKVVNKDSLFYYRTYATKVYVWNGRPKNEAYGYEWKTKDGSVTMPDKYNGLDTIREKVQVWKPSLKRLKK